MRPKFLRGSRFKRQIFVFNGSLVTLDKDDDLKKWYSQNKIPLRNPEDLDNTEISWNKLRQELKENPFYFEDKIWLDDTMQDASSQFKEWMKSLDNTTKVAQQIGKWKNRQKRSDVSKLDSQVIALMDSIEDKLTHLEVGCRF